MLRGKLDALRLQEAQAPFCVASLSYVYNHHERDLAERLTELPTAIITIWWWRRRTCISITITVWRR